MHAVACVGAVGVTNPLIVSVHSNAWSRINSHEVELRPVGRDRIVHRVEPEGMLDRIYALEDYATFRAMAMGEPITHHDDVDALVQQRQKNGHQPFHRLYQSLGGGSDTFTIAENTQPADKIAEMVFRFIYIYEIRYKHLRDGPLLFMNNCDITEFENCT